MNGLARTELFFAGRQQPLPCCAPRSPACPSLPPAPLSTARGRAEHRRAPSPQHLLHPKGGGCGLRRKLSEPQVHPRSPADRQRGLRIWWQRVLAAVGSLWGEIPTLSRSCTLTTEVSFLWALCKYLSLLGTRPAQAEISPQIGFNNQVLLILPRGWGEERTQRGSGFPRAGGRGLPTFVPLVVELVELLRELRQRLLDGLRPRDREREPPLEVFHLVHFTSCPEGRQSPAGKGTELVAGCWGGTDPQPPPSRHRGRQHPELRAPLLGSPGILCAGATRGIRNLVSPGADRGQEVHGAFSELIVRAEPRAELWTLSHGCQRGACLKSVLGNSRNAWNGEKRGKSRRKAGKKE